MNHNVPIWNDLHLVHGLWAVWMPNQKDNKRTRCDECRRYVEHRDPRFRITNGKGRRRVRNKQAADNQHQYLCVDCARLYYQQTPPPYEHQPPENIEPMDQGNLF